ncbi:MAG: DUF7594 domain-containing protein [Gaiellaceae bacterium]
MSIAVLSGIALALTVVGAGSAGAQPPSDELRAFRPEADTYVSAARPEANFGRAHSLRADGAPRETAFLRFRLSKLKGSITSVTLLLHAQTKARTSYQVRRVYEDKWRERGLTFENAPRLSLRYVSSKPVRRGIWSAVDVTSFVTDDPGRVSLAVTTRSALGVAFESRESDQGPRLVIRTA